MPVEKGGSKDVSREERGNNKNKVRPARASRLAQVEREILMRLLFWKRGEKKRAQGHIFLLNKIPHFFMYFYFLNLVFSSIYTIV